MKALAGILVGAGASHVIGSVVLSVVVNGVLGIIAAPLLAIFGWFMVVPEAIGVGVQWMAYKPLNKRRLVLFTLASCVAAAAVAAAIGPKEVGKESRWRLAYALAGCCGAAASAGVVHGMKSLPDKP